jgi:hypothetical protein
VNGSPATAKGRIEQCYAFDGTNDEVDTGGAIVGLGSAFTMAGWLYLTSAATGATLYSESDPLSTGGAQHRHYLHYNSSTNRFRYQARSSGGQSNADSSVAVTLNTWYYLACTFDAGAMKLFVNGVQDGSANRTGSYANIAASHIGAFESLASMGQWMNGRLQHVMVWNDALTAAELQQQMLLRTHPVQYA